MAAPCLDMRPRVVHPPGPIAPASSAPLGDVVLLAPNRGRRLAGISARPQRLLHPFGLGNVLGGPEFLNHHAILIEDRPRDLPNLTGFPARRHHPEFDIEVLALPQVSERRLIELSILGMRER